VRRFVQSFVHAFDGVVEAARVQPNLAVHLAVAVVVLVLALVFRLSLWAFIAVVLLVALVLALELVNTAIEAQVDLASPEINPLAKRAKDTAAGAVLVVAIGALIAGAAIFVQGAVSRPPRPAAPSLDVQTAAAALASTAILTVIAKARFDRGFSGRATLLWAGLTLMYVAPLRPQAFGFWPEGVLAGLAGWAAFSRRHPGSPLLQDALAMAGGLLVGIGTVCLCLLAHDPRML
jgi:undecaprenol kinase